MACSVTNQEAINILKVWDTFFPHYDILHKAEGTYEQFLDGAGLDIDCINNKSVFIVIDQRKFLLAKIKYGF